MAQSNTETPAAAPAMTPAMTRDELRLYCTRLYGRNRWQTALSRELQVNDRTVRRWVSGASEVPKSAALCVRLMVFLDELSWLGEWRKMLEEEGL